MLNLKISKLSADAMKTIKGGITYHVNVTDSNTGSSLDLAGDVSPTPGIPPSPIYYSDGTILVDIQ